MHILLVWEGRAVANGTMAKSSGHPTEARKCKVTVLGNTQPHMKHCTKFRLSRLLSSLEEVPVPLWHGSRVGVWQGGQDVDTGLSGQHGVLKLGGALAVLRNCCPSIRPSLVVMSTSVDHRFDGECVPRAHHAHSLVATVVRYVRRGVEQLVYTVPAVALYHCEVLFLRYLGDGLANLAVHDTGLDCRDGIDTHGRQNK